VNKKWYQSRKFWLAVGSAMSIGLADAYGFELNPETIATIAGIVIAWIVRQGTTDAKVSG